jgi:predicted metal-dependent RNase
VVGSAAVAPGAKLKEIIDASVTAPNHFMGWYASEGLSPEVICIGESDVLLDCGVMVTAVKARASRTNQEPMIRATTFIMMNVVL